jgi:hypothetical protein
MSWMTRRVIPLVLVAAVMPLAASAASAPSFSAFRTNVVANSSAANAYAAGATVTLAAPIEGDFSGFGGSVLTVAPVKGDALLVGGSVTSRAFVGGDIRSAGGTLSFAAPSDGDLVAMGFSVHDSGTQAGSVFIAALNAEVTGGAEGSVRIYGNSVTLGGEFEGDVRVASGGRLTLLPGTLIRGTLSYEAPEPATIPDSAKLLGGVEYTDTSYLPSAGASRLLGYLSIGIFLLVRILGALILAGLIAGLFPRFAQTLAHRAYAARVRALLLTGLLGFAVLVATPVLLVLLALTFVGIGIAALLFVGYLLLLLLAAIYAGILSGSLLVRRFGKREGVRWSDGVLGMLLLSLLALVPYAGPFVVIVLTTYCAGALLLQFFHFAFPRE